MNKNIVVGDIHSMGEEFLRTVAPVARETQYPLILLGDLVDRGDSLDVLLVTLDNLRSEGLLEAVVVGNHDYKLHRYLCGSKVSLGTEAQKTAAFFNDHPDHAEVFVSLVEDGYIRYRKGNHVFVHAAVHHHHLDSIPYKDIMTGKVKKGQVACNFYGFTTGEYKDGFPVRLDDWQKDVPSGITVWKGHDYVYDEVRAFVNDKGGTVVYMDTGGGKAEGRISHMIVEC